MHLTDPTWPRTIVVLLLSLSPFFFVIFEQRAIRRQQNILQQFAPELRKTQLWLQAQQLLNRRYFLTGSTARRDNGPPPPNIAYFVSLGVVCLLMLSSWSFLLEEPFGVDWFVKAPNLILSGPPSGVTAPATTESFQTDTLAVTGVAFAVAYVVVIRRMLMRLNINEHSSLENLFDAVHLTGAIVMAAVGKVVLEQVHGGLPAQLFFAVGAGVRPDFYLAALGQAAFGFLLRTMGSLADMSDPARKPMSPDDMPRAVQIEAVDGLCGGVLGRVQRIDIETCQRLAFANPFVVACRVSWNVKEVTDWINQALLAIHLPTKQKALNEVGIRTVTDLLSWLDGTGGGPAALGPSRDADALRKQLLEEPQICLLQELIAALRLPLQAAPPQAGGAGGAAQQQQGATGPGQTGAAQPGSATVSGQTGEAQPGGATASGQTGEAQQQGATGPDRNDGFQPDRPTGGAST